MRLIKLWPCALLALLIACGPPQPQYQTNYELTPPPTQTGKMCSNNCLLSQQSCKQNCAMQQQNCEQTRILQEQNDRLQARQDYEDYVRTRTRQGKLIKREPSDFTRYNGISCEKTSCEAACDQTFNMCYSNCGGKVTPHTSCVANCTIPAPGKLN